MRHQYECSTSSLCAICWHRICLLISLIAVQRRGRRPNMHATRHFPYLGHSAPVALPYLDGFPYLGHNEVHTAGPWAESYCHNGRRDSTRASGGGVDERLQKARADVSLLSPNHHDRDAFMLVGPVRGARAWPEYEMSYPFRQSPYSNDYSNPASPWSIEPQHQQGQQQQPQTPVPMGTPSVHSNLTISPPAYQLSPIDSPHLPPPHEPLLFLEPQAPAQETANAVAQVFPAPRTIQIEERASRPSQPAMRFESIDESFFRSQRESAGTRTRVSSKAPARAGKDEMRTSSTSPSSSGAGPSRVPHSRARDQAHPYISPGGMSPGMGSRRGAAAADCVSHSASGMSATGRTHIVAESGTARPSRDTESLRDMRSAIVAAPPCPAGKEHVWRVQPPTHTSSTSNHPSSPSVEATEGEPVGVTTTRYAVLTPPPSLCVCSGESSSFQSSLSCVRNSTDTTSAMANATLSIAKSPPMHKFAMDICLDEATNTVIAVLDVPGVTKETIRINLVSCPFSGCRQMIVRGERRSNMPESRFRIIERKTGWSQRKIIVPRDTQVRPPFGVAL